MQIDFRKTTFSNIQHIRTQIDKIQHISISHLRDKIITSIRQRLDLLKNDLVLIYNQNFYFSCKLLEKEKQLKQIQQKYQQLQESRKLDVNMLRAKYEKSLHQLKYSLFNKKDSAMSQVINEQMQKMLCSEVFQQIFPTPKKTLTFRDTHSALDHKDTLSKPQTRCKQEQVQLKQFDLEIRLEAAKSEQIHQKTPSILKEAVRSQAQTEEEEKRKRKKRKVSDDIGQKDEPIKVNGQGKRSELAKLVSLQMKVPVVKEKYFSTDI